MFKIEEKDLEILNAAEKLIPLYEEKLKEETERIYNVIFKCFDLEKNHAHIDNPYDDGGYYGPDDVLGYIFFFKEVKDSKDWKGNERVKVYTATKIPLDYNNYFPTIFFDMSDEDIKQYILKQIDEDAGFQMEKKMQKLEKEKEKIKKEFADKKEKLAKELKKKLEEVG